MIRDVVADVRVALADPLDVAARLGLRGRRRGAVVRVTCPWHSPDRDPSCVLSTGADRTLRAWCFSCSRGGDLLSLVAAVNGLDTRTDFPRVLELAADLAGVRLDAPRLERPRTHDPIADLARRIRLLGEDYARGHVRVDQFVESAGRSDLAAAFERLHAEDQRDRDLADRARAWERS